MKYSAFARPYVLSYEDQFHTDTSAKTKFAYGFFARHRDLIYVDLKLESLGKAEIIHSKLMDFCQNKNRTMGNYRC